MPYVTVTSLKRENDSLKEDLRRRFENLQKSLTRNEAQESGNGGEPSCSITKDEALNTLQYYGKSYDDLCPKLIRVFTELHQYNVKIVGLPEIDSRESASATTSLCISLLKASGVDINEQNVDIAYRVPTRQATAGPRPNRQRRSYLSNEGSLQDIGNIDWSAECSLGDVKILDHLTTQTQKLLADVKKFQTRNGFSRIVFSISQKNIALVARALEMREIVREEKIKLWKKKFKYSVKKKSEDYQRISQELQKGLESVKEEQRNLQLLSENLEAAKKEQQQKIRQLKRKNEEPENKVTKKTSAFEKILASVQKLRKVLDCLEKSLANFKAKNVDLENMSEEKKPLHEDRNAERSKCDDLTAEIRRLNLRLSPKMAGRIHYYSKDFYINGVVYALTTNFRGPNSTQTRIIATRSSDEEGKATDILENRVDREIVSGTKAEEQSWWCVDLTENYALYLTHYTLRHGSKTNTSYLLNWRLEGSLDGQSWQTLRRHDNDRGLTGNHPYRRCTWAIDGNVNAFRYFRILQTGKNSSGRFGIFLSGIELYGVLIEIGS
ncbi:E3 ubiquitin-protein ligase hecd-1 [Acropora cervicornis]|uniref:E3 ubiquitin-protein ligase hecd-1 n=1 Tax=Acropora cervicornis TaxID=6130 RepID=A0AAD9QJJ2_ACRCE|nr:E3 ubiquitin-protein ligase hecd-1 [Acropora cervicornis]